MRREMSKKISKQERRSSQGTIIVHESSKGISRDKKKRKRNAPKPGEDGYLTPTQLRNARKRRSKQKKKKQNGSAQHEISAPKKYKILFSKKQKNEECMDPSTIYLSQPLACPLVEKAKQYFRNLHMPFKIYVENRHGWRTVSKLPVRNGAHDGNEKTCVIGLFKPNSHNVIEIPNCVAHHPSINITIRRLQKVCKELNVEPFDETDGSGFLRYVCINVDRSSKLVQITLVWNSDPHDKNQTLKTDEINLGQIQLNLLTKTLISRKDYFKIHSVWVHFNAQCKHSDSVFNFGTTTTCNKLWKLIYGPHQIVEELNIPGLPETIKLHFQPNVFRQANLDAFTKIIISIRKYIIKYSGKRENLPPCLELYGGVGTISLCLHDVTSNLLSSDENPFNKNCFMKSVHLLPSTTQERISYKSKSASAIVQDKALFLQNLSEIVIVDPPKKGLDNAVLQELTQKNKKKSCIFNETKLLIYVSCGFEAFERDCYELIRSNKWSIDHAEGYLLFPGSNAIETLAFFMSK